jgi:DnaJ-class molecular chaperone
MYEDFTYITDESFLSDYWLEEPVICHHCRGKGKYFLENSSERVTCGVCKGSGKIKRRQQQLLLVNQ